MALGSEKPTISRGSARLRLTLLYSGMFLALGTTVVAIIYLLASTGSSVQSSVALAVPVGGQTNGAGHAAARALTEIAHQQQSADGGRLLTASWLVLLVTTLASAVIGWFIAGRVLRPLREMTVTARTISARNLGERLALSGPDDEFKRLGDTLDELLSRLQAAFESQRRFVANAAHELRTPLTVERTLLAAPARRCESPRAAGR